MAKKKTRLVRGRDWHGWVCKMKDDTGRDVLCYWAEVDKGESVNDGKWVRVKFVEVD